MPIYYGVNQRMFYKKPLCGLRVATDDRNRAAREILLEIYSIIMVIAYSGIISSKCFIHVMYESRLSLSRLQFPVLSWISCFPLDAKIQNVRCIIQNFVMDV